MRRLQLEGLTLEPQTRAHAEAMYTLLCDPALYTYENAPPESLEWLKKRFIRLESRQSPDGREKWLNWVARGEEGQCMGFVQATVFGDHRALIAYVFGSAYWGKGFARLSVEAMMDELIAAYGVLTFEAVLKQGNIRSMRLLEHLNFCRVAESGGVEPDEYRMRRSA